jgi:hypothetical protein
VTILDPQTAMHLRMLSDVLAFIEYMSIVIATTAVAVTTICAVAATRPGTQALVSAVMAHTRKDPPEAPSPAAQPRIVPVSPPPTGPALKLQSGD